MTHEEKMAKAWEFISNTGITDDPEKFKENNQLIFVENLYSVRDAFYSDLEKEEELLEKGWSEDEDVYQFLDRHKIDWQ